MNPLTAPLAALGLLVAGLPALAATTVLDFEGPTSFASIAEYYNAGADGAGATGPALGVSFGGDALALRNDALGTYFSGAPSPLGVMTPVGGDATMNVVSGFNGAISFFYSSSAFVPNAVQVWSGLNGGGSLLASFNLVGNSNLSGCSGADLCNFDQVSTTFFGTARSVSFGPAANLAAFDNLQITAVPEPASLALLLLGVVAVGAVAQRRAR